MAFTLTSSIQQLDSCTKHVSRIACVCWGLLIACRLKAGQDSASTPCETITRFAMCDRGDNGPYLRHPLTSLAEDLQQYRMTKQGIRKPRSQHQQNSSWAMLVESAAGLCQILVLEGVTGLLWVIEFCFEICSPVTTTFVPSPFHKLNV